MYIVTRSNFDLYLFTDKRNNLQLVSVDLY